MPPHRAGPDAYVTAKILERMLAIATLDQLVAWTCEPKSLPKMPFGKHKNARWADIPADYCIITRQSDMDAYHLVCQTRIGSQIVLRAPIARLGAGLRPSLFPVISVS